MPTPAGPEAAAVAATVPAGILAAAATADVVSSVTKGPPPNAGYARSVQAPASSPQLTVTIRMHQHRICLCRPIAGSRRHCGGSGRLGRLDANWLASGQNSPRASQLPAAAQPCLVAQKIVAISSILASSSSALAGSVLPFVPPAPASLVASLKSWCSCGYFSKCGGLK